MNITKTYFPNGNICSRTKIISENKSLYEHWSYNGSRFIRSFFFKGEVKGLYERWFDNDEQHMKKYHLL